MKILITGSRGMFGQDLIPLLSRRHEVIPIDLAEADITDAPAIAQTIRLARPDVVIHAAAFTAVDRCESERNLAFRVNGDGTRNVALACRELAIPMAYISTDYVFDGEKSEPYVESDPAHPLSVYGESKLEGEKQVKALLEQYWIIRTSWLFGPHGKNFVSAILGQAARGAPLRVVNDQVGSPTYTGDLAAAAEKVVEGGAPGVYHVTNQGWCSWFDFACEILRQAGIDPSRVIPIAASDLGRPAPRPKNSRLANTRLAAEGIPLLPQWQDALRRYLARAGEANQ